MKSLTGKRWTYTASGLVTVLAARIGAISSESRVYVGPETYHCIERLCNCDFIGLQKAKNIKDPIPIYWVKNAHSNYFFKENS
jgi:hypothetical protein